MRKPRPQATRPKEEPKPAPRTSVIDRLNHSKPRISALNHISGRDRTSVFKRITTPTLQGSVFERLEETKKPSRNRKTTPKEEKLDSLAGKDDVQSLIPSRMKSQAALEVDTKGPLKDRTEVEAQKDKEDEIPEEDVISSFVNSKSSLQSLEACSKTMPVKPSKVEGWTHVTPKKLYKKHMTSPQVHTSERGQSNFRQPPKQYENVEDEEISTQRSTMRDLSFLRKFFNYSVKAACYEDCEEQLSRIA
ncbi:hypothetical protein TB2_025128 [Malus domestica]